jgi:hypothetical protein
MRNTFGYTDEFISCAREINPLVFVLRFLHLKVTGAAQHLPNQRRNAMDIRTETHSPFIWKMSAKCK